MPKENVVLRPEALPDVQKKSYLLIHKVNSDDFLCQCKLTLEAHTKISYLYLLMKKGYKQILIILIIYGFIINIVWATSHNFIKIGDLIPQFTLYDQNNCPVSNKDLQGKIVVMNFIFTRCGAPTMCPSATKKMREVQNLIKEQSLQNDIQFVSISFDPNNDTSKVLNQYAQGFNIDFSNYSFLTGDPEVIKRLTKQFGVFTVSEKGTINHTMKTVVIDKTGTMVYETSKVDWKPETLLSAIKKTLKNE